MTWDDMICELADDLGKDYGTVEKAANLIADYMSLQHQSRHNTRKALQVKAEAAYDDVKFLIRETIEKYPDMRVVVDKELNERAYQQSVRKMRSLMREISNIVPEGPAAQEIRKLADQFGR